MIKRTVSISAVAAILTALTVCGSFFDLEIANAIYIGQTPSENFFGIIVSYIGIIPTFVGWSFLGASILCLSKKQVENPTKRRWLTVLAILLFVISFFCEPAKAYPSLKKEILYLLILRTSLFIILSMPIALN